MISKARKIFNNTEFEIEFIEISGQPENWAD